MDLVGPTLYTDHQSGIDDTVPHGWNYYWKATNLTDLSDEVIDVVAEHAYRVRSPRSYAAIFHLGGAVAREPSVVAGRRALYEIRGKDQAAALVYKEDTLTQVYRALAMFDVLALYAENGWIDEATVLDEWGNSLARSMLPAEHFIAARYQTIQWHSWPHDRALAVKAQRRSGSPAS